MRAATSGRQKKSIKKIPPGKVPEGICYENVYRILVILSSKLLLAINGPEDLTTSTDRWFFKRRTCAQFPKNACFFKFLLETLKRLVNRLVFLDVNDQHETNCLGRKYSAKRLYFAKLLQNRPGNHQFLDF